jgi:hemerythrin-like metal-binding protein
MAQLITWSDRYSVGIARMDAQHQRMVELINELRAAMLEGDGSLVVGKILDGLMEYTVTHFAAEEALMQEAAYPDYAQHKAEHGRLTEQVKLLKKKAPTANVMLPLELAAFLRRWLIGHIVDMDKKYSAHLNAAGVR